MPPEEEQAVAYHVGELAKLLTNLGEIEAAVREQVQKHVTPKMGVFLSKQLRVTLRLYPRQLKSILT